MTDASDDKPAGGHEDCTAGNPSGDVLLQLPGGREDGVDPCIVDLVIALNAGGLRTIASCCGHGQRPGSVLLEDRRFLFVATEEEARMIGALFPDIHGKQPAINDREAK